MTVGHDVRIEGSDAPNGIAYDICDTSINHDLIFQGNTATGDTDVSDNTVGHDARCASNTPAASKDGPEDGPNQAGHSNTCG